MRRAAWTVRFQLIALTVLVLFVGFAAGWFAKAQTESGGERPAAAPTSLPPLAASSSKPAVVRVPVCGPRGLTHTDVALACREGWIHPDEARLLGVNAKPDEYSCKLTEAEDEQLLTSEDESVAAASSTREESELCAPRSISADAVRMACKYERISSDFARALGIDAKPKSTLIGRYGCQLSPADAQTLEHDKELAVRSRR